MFELGNILSSIHLLSDKKVFCCNQHCDVAMSRRNSILMLFLNTVNYSFKNSSIILKNDVITTKYVIKIYIPQFMMYILHHIHKTIYRVEWFGFKLVICFSQHSHVRIHLSRDTKRYVSFFWVYVAHLLSTSLLTTMQDTFLF